MNLVQLKASRALWRRRELYRLNKMLTAKTDALRIKWKKLYTTAHVNRVNRDREIMAKRKPSVSLVGVAMVAKFEGFSSKPYKDAVGVWTIGFGETRNVGPNTKAINRLAALKQLQVRLNRDYLPAVLAANAHLAQKAIDGFTSFVYNVGTGGVASSTTVGRLLRAGNIKGAADGLLAWNKAGGRVLLGLTRRRQAERTRILS
jgi:lysozyme